jgi:acetyl-CoA synthetase
VILLSLKANESQSRGGNAMSVTAFLEARDFLLSHREDYGQAYRDFRWPELDRFNWALDYFDLMAQGNERPALWLVEEDGAEMRFLFRRAGRAGPTASLIIFARSASNAATACY